MDPCPIHRPLPLSWWVTSIALSDLPRDWDYLRVQGWRKNMEDAHLAVLDLHGLGAEEGVGSRGGEVRQDGEVKEQQLQGNGKVRLFGVFDGHGGASSGKSPCCDRSGERGEWGTRDGASGMPGFYPSRRLFSGLQGRGSLYMPGEWAGILELTFIPR